MKEICGKNWQIALECMNLLTLCGKMLYRDLQIASLKREDRSMRRWTYGNFTGYMYVVENAAVYVYNDR